MVKEYLSKQLEHQHTVDKIYDMTFLLLNIGPL
jgi:hypothetical protein